MNLKSETNECSKVVVARLKVSKAAAQGGEQRRTGAGAASGGEECGADAVAARSLGGECAK